MLLLFGVLLACVDCHREVALSYARTPMATSSGVVKSGDEFAGAVRHAGTHYEIVPSAKGLELRWEDGRELLSFFVGSRRMGRSYGFWRDGYLFQAPVGYYANRRTWDMAPGYQRDAIPDFDRPITPACLFCHASGARAAAGTLNRIVNAEGLHGITCERCHGDDADHRKIVNPRKLAPARRDAVCEQCHLAGAVRLAKAGKNLADFRPGQDLAEFLAVFIAGPSAGVRVNGHAEALARSRCRQAAPDRMWCGACHNPHRPTASFREKCLECHQPQACPSPLRDKQDCTQCHMPKSRAADGGHTVFTDHSIPRRPGQRRRGGNDALEAWFPGPVSPRDRGLAYAEMGASAHNSALVEKAWPLLRAASASRPQDPALYTQIAVLLEAAGRNEQALASYRIALDMDPYQYTALTRLAAALEAKGSRSEASTLRRRARVVLPTTAAPLQ